MKATADMIRAIEARLVSRLPATVGVRDLAAFAARLRRSSGAYDAGYTEFFLEVADLLAEAELRAMPRQVAHVFDHQDVDREHAIRLAQARMYAEETRPFPALWLGAQEPWWAWEGHAHGRVMISAKRIVQRRSGGRGRLRPADVPVFLDSGAFMWLNEHATWNAWPAHDFAEFVVDVDRQLGGLDHAGIQDWMCEAHMLLRTGLTVEEHQRRTVASYLKLRTLAPSIPWVPTLQGHTVPEYLRCAQMLRDAGVDLDDAPLVGLGSVCRRSKTAEVEQVIAEVHAGLGGRVRLHGYGVKSDAAVTACWQLASMDSMAWSDRARWLERDLRRALGLPVDAPSASVMALGPSHLDLLDLDILEFWEWKRVECSTGAQNSQKFAEHWRARQIELLAAEIIDRILAGKTAATVIGVEGSLADRRYVSYTRGELVSRAYERPRHPPAHPVPPAAAIGHAARQLPRVEPRK